MANDLATGRLPGRPSLRHAAKRSKRLSLGGIVKRDARGVYDGPFSWEHAFGFRLVGMIGHDFYRPYALTFDFSHMRLFFEKRS
jgi:hypothetical protein